MDRNNSMAKSYAYGTGYWMDDATLTDEDRHNLREYNRLMGKYKTSLCIQFKVTGSCTYGDECRYAHGQEELRPKTMPKNAKTVLCRNFEQYRMCPYGGRCMFIHRKKTGSFVSNGMLSNSSFDSIMPPMVRVSPPKRQLGSVNSTTRVNPLAISHINPMAINHAVKRGSIINEKPRQQKPLHDQVEEIRAKIGLL